MSQVTIIFPTSNKNKTSEFKFTAWSNRPQIAMPVVEMFTRLGASKNVIQELKKEAQLTGSSAVYCTSSEQDALDFVKKLAGCIGLVGKWVDENNIITDNFIIKDFSYTLRATTGGALNVTPDFWLLTLQINCITEGWSE